MKNNTDFSEKLSLMLNHIGVSKHDFAKKLGYERSNFFERLFSSEYSELFNHLWLFTGKGEMLTSKKYIQEYILDHANEVPLIYTPSKDIKDVAFVSIENYEHYITGNREVLLKTFPNYRFPISGEGTYRMFQMDGIGMYPTLSNNSYVIGKLVDQKEKIKKGTIVIIVSKTKGVFISRILEILGDEKYFLLKNDSEDSDEFKIKEVDIEEVWTFESALISEVSDTFNFKERLNMLESELSKVKKRIEG